MQLSLQFLSSQKCSSKKWNLRIPNKGGNEMRKVLSCLAIATFAATTLFSVPAARAWSAPPAQAYGQEPWAAPPQELQGAERQGFHDGIEGARKDAENHRPPNVHNRDEYRHPSVPHHDWRAYRQGFRRGYQVGVQHLMNGGR
jgi:hypothetical protein